MIVTIYPNLSGAGYSEHPIASDLENYFHSMPAEEQVIVEASFRLYDMQFKEDEFKSSWGFIFFWLLVFVVSFAIVGTVILQFLHVVGIL